jgi:type II restriction enzyme
MTDHLPESTKGRAVKRMLNEAWDILLAVGIPIVGRPLRRRERIAACMMAVAGVKRKWTEAKSSSDGRNLKTREVIPYVNQHFEENISSGSYDNVRRHDLKELVEEGFLLNSGDKPGRATNDPTRGYALSDEFAVLVRTYGTPAWNSSLGNFMKGKTTRQQKMRRERAMAMLPVTLPNGEKLRLKYDEHNTLQKAVVEEFLPRWTKGAEVLYVGDASNRHLLYESKRMGELGVPELSRNELPDIIAYCKGQNWLYVIEAVTSGGPISEARLMQLKKLLADTKPGVVYVTAFLTRKDHRKYADQIAFETEVWTADFPDHLQHLNGPRFMGPYDC